MLCTVDCGVIFLNIFFNNKEIIVIVSPSIWLHYLYLLRYELIDSSTCVSKVPLNCFVNMLDEVHVDIVLMGR